MDGKNIELKSQLKSDLVSSKISMNDGGAFFAHSSLDEYRREMIICLTKEFFSIDDLNNTDIVMQSDIKMKVTSEMDENDESISTENKIIMSFVAMKMLDELLNVKDWVNLSEQIYNQKYYSYEVEELLSKYFKVLVRIFEEANHMAKISQVMFSGYKRILEELLFMNSYRLKNENAYILTDRHPIVLMNKRLEKLNYELTAECQSNTIENSMLETIVRAKNENRSRFKIYTTNKVFEVGKFFDYYKAEGFANRDECTEISTLRLWEKIINYSHKHPEHQGVIRIACLGRLKTDDILQKLCEKEHLSYELNFFERNVLLGRYYFINRNDNSKKEVYDLLNAADIDSLFEKYQIVLFMDMNCFYKQYQHEKSIDEKNEVENCRWYLERANQFGNFKDKAIAYQLIYNHIGMWLNSYNMEKSADYEFDEKLYLSLMTAYKYNTDVYLYIKYGNKIAGNSLQFKNSCNDEFYNGRELIVYKLGREESVNDKCIKLIRQEHQMTTKVKFWKILKSINNEFCMSILSDFSKENNFAIDNIIMWCRNTDILFDFTNVNLVGQKKLICRIQTNGVYDNIIDKVTEIVKVVLNHALGKRNIICIRRYFRQLITNSIVSNAENISALIFAYLFEKGELEDVNLEIKKECVSYEFTESDSEFVARRTIYSIIKKLAGLRIRSIEDRNGYFTYTVRKEICPEINENVFKIILKNVAECCQEFGYEESLLYNNSQIE